VQPIDVPTAETLAFIRPYLPAKPARLLEVGCGEGHLAWQLDRLGYAVIAVDSSAEAIGKAQRSGVVAYQAEWPDFETAQVNAVLFTRSLHHIHHLEQAVAQAARLLKPGGLVIVDEFDFYAVDPVTIAWFYGSLRLLEHCRQLHFTEEGVIKRLLAGEGDFALWQRDHAHDLHSVAAMWASLKTYFEPVVETSAPYLYRYLPPLLDSSEQGYHLVKDILETEQKLAQVGAITLIGRRFVGRLR
jgi:SAM-dependent methyltransferase